MNKQKLMRIHYKKINLLIVANIGTGKDFLGTVRHINLINFGPREITFSTIVIFQC